MLNYLNLILHPSTTVQIIPNLTLPLNLLSHSRILVKNVHHKNYITKHSSCTYVSIKKCGRRTLQINIKTAHFAKYGEQILAISDRDLIELFSIFFLYAT